MIDFIFKSLDAEKITTGTPEEKKASIDLLKRLGFKSLTKSEYILTKEDWLKLNFQN